jgi:hypothetical protein
MNICGIARRRRSSLDPISYRKKAQKPQKFTMRTARAFYGFWRPKRLPVQG